DCRYSMKPTSARVAIWPRDSTRQTKILVQVTSWDGSAVAPRSRFPGGHMGLRDKYDHAIQTAKGFHMQGAAEERDGKLYFKGTVPSQEQANQIWDAIKTVPDWQHDVVADIKATGTGAAAAGPASAGPRETYT